MRLLAHAVLLTVPFLSTARADCLGDLQAVVDKHVNSGAYRVEMIMQGDNPIRITAEVIMPDKFHMVMPQGEAIIVGDQSWMKMGGKWMQIPGMGKAVGGLTKQTELISAESAKNLVCSDAVVEGKNYRMFEFDASGKAMGIDSTSHVKLYADAGTGLPARQQIDGEAMGKSSSITQIFTFDSTIEIVPPK